MLYFVGEQHGASWMAYGSYLCLNSLDNYFVAEAKLEKFFYDLLNGVITKPSAILVSAFVPAIIKNSSVRAFLSENNIKLGWILVDKFAYYAPSISAQDFSSVTCEQMVYTLDNVLMPDFYVVNNLKMAHDFEAYGKKAVVLYTPTSLRVCNSISCNIALSTNLVTYDGSLSWEALSQSLQHYNINFSSFSLELDFCPWQSYPPSKISRALFNIRGSEAESLKSFIHRWKPSSKLSVAAAMGIPYITEFEQSTYELRDSYPVYFYRDTQELKDIFSMLQDDFLYLEIHRRCRNSQAQWLNGFYSYPAQANNFNSQIANLNIS